MAPLLVSPSSTAESTFALVFNGSRKEVKAFADIDGVDAGKGRFANPGQECTIECSPALFPFSLVSLMRFCSGS